MHIDLKGAVALVTGGTSGIGESIVRRLAEANCHVALHYHTDKEKAYGLQKSLGSGVAVFEADLNETPQCDSLFDDAVQTFQKIDILVNNAGIYRYAPIDDYPRWLDAWHRTMQINLLAGAVLSRRAILHFKKTGGGRIIHIASRAAFRGDTQDYLAYAASKGAMVSLSKTIARAYGKDNIKSFVIAPGFVRTKMAQEFIEKNGVETVLQQLALNTMTEPDDIAPSVVFLASGFMDHMTGNTIDLNAGSYVR